MKNEKEFIKLGMDPSQIEKFMDKNFMDFEDTYIFDGEYYTRYYELQMIPDKERTYYEGWDSYLHGYTENGASFETEPILIPAQKTEYEADVRKNINSKGADNIISKLTTVGKDRKLNQMTEGDSETEVWRDYLEAKTSTDKKRTVKFILNVRHTSLSKLEDACGEIAIQLEEGLGMKMYLVPGTMRSLWENKFKCPDDYTYGTKASQYISNPMLSLAIPNNNQRHIDDQGAYLGDLANGSPFIFDPLVRDGSQRILSNISFAGKSGSGKSSAMKSFGKYVIMAGDHLARFFYTDSEYDNLLSRTVGKDCIIPLFSATGMSINPMQVRLKLNSDDKNSDKVNPVIKEFPQILTSVLRGKGLAGHFTDLVVEQNGNYKLIFPEDITIERIVMFFDQLDTYGYEYNAQELSYRSKLDVELSIEDKKFHENILKVQEQLTHHVGSLITMFRYLYSHIDERRMQFLQRLFQLYYFEIGYYYVSSADEFLNIKAENCPIFSDFLVWMSQRLDFETYVDLTSKFFAYTNSRSDFEDSSIDFAVHQNDHSKNTFEDNYAFVIETMENFLLTFGAYFNKHSTFDKLTDTPIYAFDYSGIQEAKNIPGLVELRIFLALSQAMQDMLRHGIKQRIAIRDGILDPKDRKFFFLVIDEMQNIYSPELPVSIKLVNTWAQQSRKSDSCILYATPSMLNINGVGAGEAHSDILNEMKRLAAQTQYKFLMKIDDPGELDAVRAMLSGLIPESWPDKLPSFGKGDFLLSISSTDQVQGTFYLSPDDNILFDGGQ